MSEFVCYECTQMGRTFSTLSQAEKHENSTGHEVMERELA